ncbi:MAG: ABC transporter ATP-binding protein [Chloroflexia bacterium]|nr:ABC transporter ATP-binding protein [Chloroflexia bacterium]MDQ3412190.1 ABC transporter ATP-binding protein [Chloroflexota bacterium]
MSPPPPPVLSVSGLTSGYGEVPVVRDISIEVGASEIVTIIGPNGAGKSTVLKAIFGLLRTWDGQVQLDGTSITGLPPERLVRQGIGYVPQTENIFSSLTIRENLAIGGFTRATGLAERIDWVFALFPVLAERPNERASRLSGGQRQTLAIGRALMLEPRLLMLDEPSASLSPIMLQTVFENVVEINRRGTAILMVEQNARQALSISHRGYVLANGINRLTGPAADLLASDEVRRLYLGE